MGQTNRALLVAIDKYPEGSGWAEIHATNDIELLRPMLAAKNFKDGNVIVLTNEQATWAAIVREFEKLGRNTRSGDYIYIHFSCHGQQMADDNGDEPDGLDEAIIPYDARRRYEDGVYEGGNHLRDDDLEGFIEDIRTKAGPKGRIVLVVDACHSGTADRDTDDDVYVRGTTYIFAPPGYVPVKNEGTDVVIGIKAGKRLSPLTVIAACQPDQLNYEYRMPDNGKYYGSLTYALCGLMGESKELSQALLQQELAARVGKQNIRRRKVQTPLVETSDEAKNFRIGR